MNCKLSTGDGHAMGTVGGALLVVVGAWRALAAWRSKPKPCADGSVSIMAGQSIQGPRASL